ncbi:uncharacterized protein LOC142350502 [Convolutriloba macropyga]|uniref:uncharacterized protein LOC142350502 n=1 Tax=Convolutriloba macropyga TaxID=536237 RepID=UPI003F521218
MKPFLRHYRMFCLSTHILSTVGQRRISDGKYKSRNGQYEISFDDFTRNGVKIWSTADHSDEKQSSSFLVKGHQSWLSGHWKGLEIDDKGILQLYNEQETEFMQISNKSGTTLLFTNNGHLEFYDGICQEENKIYSS